MASAETLRRLKGQIAHTKRGEKGKKRESVVVWEGGGGVRGRRYGQKEREKKGVRGEVGEGV